MRVNTVLNTIGQTPMIRLTRMNLKSGVRIMLKLEGHNPGGSVKDRIALAMIQGADPEES